MRQLGHVGAINLADPASVAYDLAAYAGSWLGGSAVGYVVSKRGSGAVTGGLTTSGIWAVANGLGNVRINPPVLTGAYLGFGVLSLVLAWRR